MFSMFGGTGAPTKRGPTRGPAIFCNISNMPEIIEIIIRKQFCVARWRHKVLSLFCVHIIALCESLTKC